MKISLRNILQGYNESLFSLKLDNKIQPPNPYNVEFINISLNNYQKILEINKNVDLERFKKMLTYGDIGKYAIYDNKLAGYGWAKFKGSQDYFFHISECYLCRFFVSSSMRGKGIYPLIINELIKQAHNERGLDTFYIAAETSNKPSINGLRKIGFEHSKDIRFIRAFRITFNKFHLKSEL